jgi:hypothetical protein
LSTSNTMSKVTFSLEALVSSVSSRSEHGTLILVIDDKNVQGLYTYKKLKKVTDNWETANKAYITTAFSDYGVNKVMVASAHVDADTTVDGVDNITKSLPTALALLNKVYENGWLVAPQVTSTSDKAIVANFIKTQRADEDYPLKGVLYNYSADSEGIVNFTASDLQNTVTSSTTVDNATVDSSTVSGATTVSVDPNTYLVSIASNLCVLGSNESITNHVAKNITNCDIKDDPDVNVSNGEIFLFNNGTDIVFSRGVNSKTTIGTDESEALTKIRVIEVIDMVKSDLRKIFNSTYLGKTGNSYANRKSLTSTLNTYLKGISNEGYLSNDDVSYCELDVDSTKTYLEAQGTDTDEMTDSDVLKAKIGTNVFIKIKLYVMDVIEDISIVLQYET